MIALTDVGRCNTFVKGTIFEGTWQEIQDRLEACFINGCEIERQNKGTKWKVFAGYGSHVADIKLLGYDKKIKKKK